MAFGQEEIIIEQKMFKGLEVFEENEILELGFYWSSYPNDYEKIIKDKQEKEDEISRNIGRPPKTIVKSFKEAGIDWTCVIIARGGSLLSNGELHYPSEKLIKFDEETGLWQFNEDYPLFTHVSVYPPNKLKESKALFKYQKGGFKIFDPRSPYKPIYTKLVPDNKIDIYNQKFTTANSIENSWRPIIERYNTLSENEAKAEMNEYLAQQMLICQQGDTQWEYHPATFGQHFYAAVDKKMGKDQQGKEKLYCSLKVFERIKVGTKDYQDHYYSSCNIPVVTQEQKDEMELLYNQITSSEAPPF